MKGKLLILWTILLLQVTPHATTVVSLYDSASHYWPLDQTTGVDDVKSNRSGVIRGSSGNINFSGPNRQFLYTEGNSWLDLGDFRGTCLSEPAFCVNSVTVSIWLRYTYQLWDKKQVFLGTTSKNCSRGFTIYSEPGERAKNAVVVKVSTLKRDWLGRLQVTRSGIWTHVMFTWSNSSGLSVYKNCELVSSSQRGRSVTPSHVCSTSDQWSGHLSLSSSNDGRKRTQSDCSYDDVAVWYTKLSSQDLDSLFGEKVDPPERLSCKRSSTWLEVTWDPPDPSYDVLIGYDVWLSDPDRNTRKVGSIKGTTFNSTNLVPDSTYTFRVQNKLINGKLGRNAGIACTTDPTILGMPSNLTVETKSISAILLRWGPPKQTADLVAGYKVFYKVAGSKVFDHTLDVGPLEFFLFTKLLVNQEYVIHVVAYNDDTNIRDSEPAEIKARTDINGSLSVSDVKLKELGPTVIRVSWTPPPDKHKTFVYSVVLAWKESSRQKMILIYEGNATAYEHSMVKLDRPHSFLVIARVTGEIAAKPITAPPVNVTVVSVGWNDAFLWWDPPLTLSQFVDSYRLIVTSGRETRVLTSRQNHLLVDGLKQLTNYWVNIQAGNKAGYGPLLPAYVQFKTKDRNECRDGFRSCHPHASCTNTVGSFFCKCREGFVGDGRKCEKSDNSEMCSNETSFGIMWSKTLVGETDVTLCPTGTTGIASRPCSSSLDGGTPVWGTPDLTGCVSGWLTDAVQQLDNPNVNTTSLAHTLAELTDVQANRQMYAGDLRMIVDVIGTLSRDASGKSSSPLSGAFVEAVISTSSNVLDSKNLDTWSYMPQNSRVAQVGSLIDSLDVIALETGQSGRDAMTDTPNVVMSVASPDPVEKERGLVMSDGGAEGKALFPASILRGLSVKYATLVSYKTLGVLLKPVSERVESKASARNVSSAVMSLTLNPPMKAPFEDPVIIVLRHDSSEQERAPECVFLDTNKSPPEWSDEGCHVKQSNSTHTTCYCYHLTSFAVLMSVKQDVASISESDRIALSVISYVGVSISVVSLCLALFTFCFFKFLKSFRVYIHKNLAISLILAQLVFLFGIDKAEHKIVCQVIAAVLHYLFLVAFCWMALEGVILYLMLVKVFQTKTTPTKTKLLFSLVGWGTPAVIVSAAGVMYLDGYGTESYCWLSLDKGFIWWFVGPVLIIMAFNFVCLGTTFSVMAKKGSSRHKSRSRRIRYWAKACTLLTCILGLSWMFGIMYINQETLFMAYFFTIFNSFQGLFIFLFHCLGDEKVRKEYMRLFCCTVRGDYLLKPSDTSTKTDTQSKNKRASGDSYKGRFARTQPSSSSSTNGTDYKKHLFVVQSDGHIQLRAVKPKEVEMYGQAHDSETSKPPSEDSCSSGGEMCETNFIEA